MDYFSTGYISSLVPYRIKFIRKKSIIKFQVVIYDLFVLLSATTLFKNSIIYDILINIKVKIFKEIKLLKENVK